MLKAVLLDFNGVVINDEAIHRALIDELLLTENLRPLTPADYQQFCLGRSDRACLVDLFEHRGRGLTEAYLQKLIDRKAESYHQKLVALETLPIYEGLKEFLNKLQLQRLAIALVTGAVRAEVEYVLDRAGLASYFPVIVAGDDITTSKPQPEGYQLAITKLNQWRQSQAVADSLLDDTAPLLPENCLAIEDTFAGIEAAKKAGIAVVGIAHTYPYHFMQRQANWAVDRFDELDLDRLQVIFSRPKVAV
ncbi:HAD family phosphatase [Synechocystis sp. LEGE 06083]|uniref:HAD family hydrolase n=1 Tax=Synechocystis sp. LEGE 06083 TaxID=915336 RepID=UPI00187F810E|nr:HAD family phosphatase [Synechocystis sp. LEGE 06083]MBE9197248.1 HAD family phosphatase [Synechocystis sp. LEGE 06083]